MILIADSTDLLTPFMHALLFKAVPTIVLCGVVGMILGSLKPDVEKGIERAVRRLVHGPESPNSVAKLPALLTSILADAPHCPVCNTIMVPRQTRRGPRAGQQFWGCSVYPKCRGTREFDTVEKSA